MRAEPRFWNELYWFTIICLGAWIVAMIVLPPRLERHRRLAEFETDLRLSVSALRAVEQQYEAAIMAMENDPFYRDEVYRAVLGIKEKDEEFLEILPP